MLSPIELPVHLTPDAPMKLRQPIHRKRMGCFCEGGGKHEQEPTYRPIAGRIGLAGHTTLAGESQAGQVRQVEPICKNDQSNMIYPYPLAA
jgi:hypothetical protein